MNAQEIKIKKETKNKIRVEFEDRTPFWERVKLKVFSFNFLKKVIITLFRVVFLLGISYVILYPFFSKVTQSFMSQRDFLDITVKLIPRYPTLDTYREIIEQNKYFTAFFNTLTLSIICAIIQTFISAFIGYGFAKFRFKGNKLLFVLVVLTMIIPHSTIKFSMFMKFRYFDVLGIFGALHKLLPGVFVKEALQLTGTDVPLILLSLTGLAFKNGLYIFMMRQFYTGIPDSLEESAYVDGSGVFRTFFSIIIPLSVPMMITIFIFTFSWQWTDNFYTDLFYTENAKWLMPNIVKIPRTLNTNFAAGELYSAAIRNTCGLMIILPLVIMYLFCQRYLIQGIERSGITGE